MPPSNAIIKHVERFTEICIIYKYEWNQCGVWTWAIVHSLWTEMHF